MTYCLLGIFSINMPLLYGEGGRAFHRLQEAIIGSVNDDSILAWGPQLDIKRHTKPTLNMLRVSIDEYRDSCEILANSPKDFTNCGNLKRAETPVLPANLTSLGLKIQLPLLLISQMRFEENSIVCPKFVGLLSCSAGEEGHFVGIFMAAAGSSDERTTETTHALATNTTGSYSTVVLSARDVLKANDRTITI